MKQYKSGSLSSFLLSLCTPSHLFFYLPGRTLFFVRFVHFVHIIFLSLRRKLLVYRCDCNPLTPLFVKIKRI